MAFIKRSIRNSGSALSAHLRRKKKTTFDKMEVAIVTDSAEQDEVTEPKSVDPTEGKKCDVATEVVEEAPSSPRSRLGSLLTVGSINSVSDVVEAQGDGDVENTHVAECISDSELNYTCDEQQGLHEEKRNDEEEISRKHRYNYNNERVRTMEHVDDDDQSQKSESSLQVLFRIVTTGLDFSIDYEGKNDKARGVARKWRGTTKQRLVLPPPTSDEEVEIKKDRKSPKEVIGMVNDDMTQVSELSSTSDLTLTSMTDEDAAIATAGCSSCVPIFSCP
jgi:hypothetical protein